MTQFSYIPYRAEFSEFIDNPSTATVLAYLRSKLRREEMCNRIKVIVLGKEVTVTVSKF